MKIRIQVLIFLFIILIIPLFSQNTFNNIYFNSMNNNIGNSIIETKDSCYIIAGELNSDALLMKIDQAGDTIWTKTYGGDQRDNAKSIVQLPDSGFIFTGFSESQDGMWLVRINPQGDALWTKVFSECGEGQQIIATYDGNYVITGSTPNPGQIDYLICDTSDTYCMKINESGDVLWQHAYDLGLSEIGLSVCETPDSGLAISLCEGVKLLRLNTDGDTLWNKEYTHNHVPEYMFQGMGHFIISTEDGGFLITGEKFINVQYDAINYLGWLINVDLNGDTLWTKTFTLSTHSIGIKSIQTHDGDFVSLFNCDGTFNGVKIIKTSNNGEILEESTIQLDNATSIIECSDSGFIVTGEIDNYISAVKIDSLETVLLLNTDNGIISKFSLFQNYPNPFNPTTSIYYEIRNDSYARLSIYNISGHLVEILTDNYHQVGAYTVTWDASKYSSGIYISTLENENKRISRKMLLIK